MATIFSYSWHINSTVYGLLIFVVMAVGNARLLFLSTRSRGFITFIHVAEPGRQNVNYHIITIKSLTNSNMICVVGLASTVVFYSL